jgi:hypothetical protein
MPNLLPALLLPLLTLAARPSPPLSAAAPGAARIEVELVEKIGGASKRERTAFVLLSDGQGSSSLEHSDEARRCEAKVSPVHEGWLLDLECRRHGNGRADLDVLASARVVRGKRTVVAAMERPDGAGIEVALTVR